MKTENNNILIIDKFQKIPNFRPYEKLKICGNEFGVQFLLDIKGFYPIIIGKNIIPDVWIYSQLGDEIITLVGESKPLNKQISSKIEDNIMNFSIHNIETDIWVPILDIDISDSKIPNVIKIDLRPIGYNFYGNESGLIIGELKLQNEQLMGGKVLFSVKN